MNHFPYVKEYRGVRIRTLYEPHVESYMKLIDTCLTHKIPLSPGALVLSMKHKTPEKYWPRRGPTTLIEILPDGSIDSPSR